MNRLQQGFTLFESLVAMTLMTLLLGALLPVFQGGLKSLQFGSQQTQAALLAQALLNRALVEQTGADMSQPTHGEMQGMRWRIQRQAYLETELPIAGTASADEPRLWQLSARVEWDDQHAVILRGLAPVVHNAGTEGKSGAS